MRCDGVNLNDSHYLIRGARPLFKHFWPVPFTLIDVHRILGAIV